MRPGERIPVDGEVIDGRSSVDESMVTGESMPVTKEENAKVIGGTLNRSGTLVIRAEKIGADSMLSRIVQMVAEAQRSRAPIQRMADRVASWFVPAVILTAMIAMAAHNAAMTAAWASSTDWSEAVRRGALSGPAEVISRFCQSRSLRRLPPV